MKQAESGLLPIEEPPKIEEKPLEVPKAPKPAPEKEKEKEKEIAIIKKQLTALSEQEDILLNAIQQVDSISDEGVFDMQQTLEVISKEKQELNEKVFGEFNFSDVVDSLP